MSESRQDARTARTSSLWKTLRTSPRTEVAGPTPAFERTKSIRVLVVDDGETNRDLVSAILRQVGATVVLAKNGEDGCRAAMREASRWKALAEHAHWLKGTGGGMGFDRFYQPANELESAAKAADEQSARQQVMRIASLAARIELAVSVG